MNRMISEVLDAFTCKHPDGSPRPTTPVKTGLPNVTVRWECTICNAILKTVFTVEEFDDGPNQHSISWWPLSTMTESEGKPISAIEVINR